MAGCTAVTRYVAFLRAINVGGRRVTMDKLRDAFTELGYDGVRTYIASGNVVFDTADTKRELEATIEAALAAALGFEVTTFLRTAAEVKKLVADDPYADRPDTASYYVVFLKKKPTATVTKAIEALSNDVDTLVVRGRDLHWLVQGHLMDSLLKPKEMERAAGRDPGTSRNITMLKKLAATL